MTKKARILVADDDFLYRTLFSASLEEAGYEVHCVCHGAEAIEAIQASSFDLLLLDLLMPIQDGFSTLKQLNTLGVLPRLAVIVVSATDEVDSFVRCVEAGALDLVPKPFEPAMLATRVRAALAHQQNELLQQKIREASSFLSSCLPTSTTENKKKLQMAIDILS
jgi:DNA-binding response OmpR family regulator